MMKFGFKFPKSMPEIWPASSDSECAFSNWLVKFMSVEGITLLEDDKRARDDILLNLRGIVGDWIHKIAKTKHVDHAPYSAQLVEFGSFTLQVSSPCSDLDVVVVAPEFTSLDDDFFTELFKRLSSNHQISNIRAIKGAKVPLIQFWMFGVQVDLAYARVRGSSVPSYEVLRTDTSYFLRAMDRRSLLALESLVVDKSILEIIPSRNMKDFKDAVRFIKHWARCRGIYGNNIGYLGAVHLAVMVAFISKIVPTSSLARVLSFFFRVYSRWDWNYPIVIDGHVEGLVRPKICIQKPGTTGFCSSYIKDGTLERIHAELDRAARLTQPQNYSHYNWRRLFDRYNMDYERYVKIRMSASSKETLETWFGFLKSRLIVLIDALKKANVECDPNVTEYSDAASQGHNRVLFWGIMHDSGEYIDLTDTEEAWRKNLMTGRYCASGSIKLAVLPLYKLKSYNRYNKVR